MSDSTISGTTGAGGGSKLRITGMASGLDVDATVKKMMTGEQIKLDKANQTQQTNQWKQDIYQDIIKDIKDWQSSFLDSSSADKNVLSSTNFTPFNVSGIGTSTVDTSVATFTPGVGVQTGKYSIAVTQLAKGAGVKNTLTDTSLSKTLTSLGLSNGDTSLKLSTDGGTTTTEIKLTVTATSTLANLVDAINNQGSGKVKASFSELKGEFKLAAASTGKETSLIIQDGTTAGLFTMLGFSTGTTAATINNADAATVTGGTIAATATIQKAQDASVSITPPGASLATAVTKSTNNFTIDGMSYTLSSEGTDINHPATASVNVGSDTDKVYDKIKGFIDKYNTIVDNIQTKLIEKKNSAYKPLTDAQKETMSTSQITTWETKAKVGILRNDDNLQNMLNSLRSAFTAGVSNAGLSFGKYGSNSFGIDTSTDYDKPAHIDMIDESKLKDAISTKSDQILKMFTNVAAVTDSSKPYDSNNPQYQQDGIFTRIKNILQTNVGFANTTLNTAILTAYANKQYDFSTTGTGGKNTLPDQIYEQQLMIKNITAKMSTKQEAYYQQFSKLETAMNQLNAQQSQLSSMLGS